MMQKGAALWVGGQRYVFADYEHVTKYGRDVPIKVWESKCATCGQLFRTNATITQATLRRLNRRCLNCLAPGVAVKRTAPQNNRPRPKISRSYASSPTIPQRRATILSRRSTGARQTLKGKSLTR
jgi:nucleotidyltransferase/DNA polymerase involved in DNA repair